MNTTYNNLLKNTSHIFLKTSLGQGCHPALCVMIIVPYSKTGSRPDKTCKTDLRALTLVGPTRQDPVLDP